MLARRRLALALFPVLVLHLAAVATAHQLSATTVFPPIRAGLAPQPAKWLPPAHTYLARSFRLCPAFVFFLPLPVPSYSCYFAHLGGLGRRLRQLANPPLPLPPKSAQKRQKCPKATKHEKSTARIKATSRENPFLGRPRLQLSPPQPASELLSSLLRLSKNQNS